MKDHLDYIEKHVPELHGELSALRTGNREAQHVITNQWREENREFRERLGSHMRRTTQTFRVGPNLQRLFLDTSLNDVKGDEDIKLPYDYIYLAFDDSDVVLCAEDGIRSGKLAGIYASSPDPENPDITMIAWARHSYLETLLSFP